MNLPFACYRNLREVRERVSGNRRKRYGRASARAPLESHDVRQGMLLTFQPETPTPLPPLDAEDRDRGARRRRGIRAVLGRPGSLRRWMLGMAVWVFACVIVSLYVVWELKIVVFIVAAVVATATFRARAFKFGDEDELRAALKFSSIAHMSDPDPAGEDDETREGGDADDRGVGRFRAAPPPPIVDDGDSQRPPEGHGGLPGAP